MSGIQRSDGQMVGKAKSGIGRRLAKLLALVTFLAVLLSALAHTILHTQREIEARVQSLEATAYALAAASGDAVADSNRSKALSSLSAVSRIPNILMANIVLPDKSVFASMGQIAYLSDDILTGDDGTLALLYKGMLPVSVDIIKGGEIRGRLVVVENIENFRSEIIQSILATFGVALIAAFLGVMASRPVQRRIVKPLTELTSTIQDIRKSHDFSAVLSGDDQPDETGILVKAFNGLMRDIRLRDDSLQKLAYFDPLTGLGNRVSILKLLDSWMQHRPTSQTGAVLLVNIHGFRSINDAFSHSIGDALLMTVAATVKSGISEDDTLARYSGDEFVVLLRNAETQDDVDAALAKIQSAFIKPLQIGELELHVTLTAGAVMLQAREEADAILRHVDLALADAKKQAAGTLSYFRPELAESVEQDTVLGQALRLAAQSGSFDLHYQPQFDLRHNRVSGYEALVRWNHPERGPISPAVFIPLAERIGLVTLIGDWVLTQGCKQAALWLQQGQPERMMSINVSPAQILVAGFVEKVRAALRESGLPPSLLCLELTESMFVGARYAETVHVLETLASDGVTLALDDFGTGYSSLAYLSKLPFHTIKIDRAFVSGIDKRSNKMKMLKSIVDMVHVLGMSVLVEGAETMEEVAQLRVLGVEEVQGYAFARPQPRDAACALANDIDQRQMVLSA